MAERSESVKLLDAYMEAVDEYRHAVTALTRVGKSSPLEFAEAMAAAEYALGKTREARLAIQAFRTKQKRSG